MIIVGAGAAGLGCATRLARAGVPFTLLEAASRVGGRAHTSSWTDGDAVDADVDSSTSGDGGVLDGLGGGATAGDRTAAFAREVMAARPSGEAEPMLRWSGEEEAEEDDSWFL